VKTDIDITYESSSNFREKKMNASTQEWQQWFDWWEKNDVKTNWIQGSFFTTKSSHDVNKDNENLLWSKNDD